jgi:hypothetical protein
MSRVGFLVSRDLAGSPEGVAVQAAVQQAGVSLVGPGLEGTIQETEYRRVFKLMTQARASAHCQRSIRAPHLRPHGRLPVVIVLQPGIELLDGVDLGVDDLTASCVAKQHAARGERKHWLLEFSHCSSVILRRGTADKAMQAMREMMERLKLTVNENKTHLSRVPDASFDFLGYTFGRCYSPKTGRSYIGTRPSRKSIAKVRRTISAQTSRRWLISDI